MVEQNGILISGDIDLMNCGGSAQLYFIEWMYAITYPPGSRSGKKEMLQVSSGLCISHWQGGALGGLSCGCRGWACCCCVYTCPSGELVDGFAHSFKWNVGSVKTYPREASFKIISSAFVFIVQKVLNVRSTLDYISMNISLEFHEDTLVEEQWFLSLNRTNCIFHWDKITF